MANGGKGFGFLDALQLIDEFEGIQNPTPIRQGLFRRFQTAGGDVAAQLSNTPERLATVANGLIRRDTGFSFFPQGTSPIQVGGKPTLRDLQRNGDGSLALAMFDERAGGIVGVPAGTRPSDFPRDAVLFALDSRDGSAVRIRAGKRRRRMNPMNARANKRAIKRIDGAVREAKKLFRMDAKIKKTVKRRAKRRK